MRRRVQLAIAAASLVALSVPAASSGALGLPAVDPTVPAARDTEPVVLTGRDFPGWSVPANQTVKVPLTDIVNCPTTNTDSCSHNHYVDPEIDTARAGQPAGTPTDRVLGYRWNPKPGKAGKFQQIPFQVDEMFTRYLENSASGFAFYSGDDQHTTYAFDREGWRFTDSDPSNPCQAIPFEVRDANGNVSRPPTTLDPVKGLDDNDELAFMATDAGPAAPDGAALPKGIQDARRVSVVDPLTQETKYVYVMRAGNKGPDPAYDASNGYVHYARDANADTYERSISSFGGYGNAAKGTYCDAAGNPIGVDKRRPRDYAWITTPRYQFRYDGRWLMTQLRVSPDGGQSYGADLIDRWKARAFKQDPSSVTPCCGYEEEDTNWGGSSTLLGERVGPVRAIRATWGADSGTNVVRQESFYRDEMRQKSWLRVHPIPPLDGIYAQWDFGAGIVNRFYNDKHPDGVAIDGRNDEMYGNFDDPCNPKYDANDTSQTDQQYRSLYRQLQLCRAPDHLSIDTSDPTFSDANASLGWSEVAGPNGTIVDRISVDKVGDVTPGGAAQSVAAVPYYRDDSCFDDGTGTDPGPKLHLRSGDEPTTYTDPATGETKPRRCWHPEDGLPNASPAFYQGSIATHGVHLLFIGESDNARQTVPLDEIVSEQRMVMLPGDPGNVGERYGRGFEKPLVTGVSAYQGSPADELDLTP